MKQRETQTEKKFRIKRGRSVLRTLRKQFPNAGMMLTYSNNWELLVAVQLSAQCTDKKVNEITPSLFKTYPTLHDYVVAGMTSKGIKKFETMIYQSGFFRNKTKNILAAAKMIEERFHGTIPKSMEEILIIPGVARKTANVVLGNAYGVSLGIAVDTHVKRLSHVLALSDELYPEKIEKDLMEVFLKCDWFHITYLLIEYGRKYCPARKHERRLCPLGHFSET